MLSESEALAGIDAAVLKAHADVINESYGFSGWVNKRHHAALLRWDDPEYKLVDLVAPGHGGEAACNPHGSDCPTNTQTEAFDGSSQSSPLIVGAAVDVTQAYRDSYNGDSPSPALVKQLLTGTATDVDAPADQQGAGLVNINAAVAAAQQQPVTSVATHTTMTGNPPRTRTVNGVPLTGGSVTFHVPNPMAGTGEIDVELNLTTSGKEFTQTVVGDLLAQAPAITSPADGASPASRIRSSQGPTRRVTR